MAKDGTNRGDRRVCAGSKRETFADRIINGKADITQSGACGNLVRNSAGWESKKRCGMNGPLIYNDSLLSILRVIKG